METEDGKIKKLFEESLPAMSSEKTFILRITRGIEAVSMVEESMVEYRRKNKWIAIVSGFSGFLCGIILTLFYPFISSFVSNISLRFLELTSFHETITITLACILIASGSLCVSIATYFGLNRNLSIRKCTTRYSSTRDPIIEKI